MTAREIELPQRSQGGGKGLFRFGRRDEHAEGIVLLPERNHRNAISGVDEAVARGILQFEGGARKQRRPGCGRLC